MCSAKYDLRQISEYPLEHLAVAGQHWSCSTAALQQVTPAPGLRIIYQASNLANTSILHTAGLNLTTLYYQVCVLYLLCYTPPQSKYMYLYRGVEIISTSVVHIGYENIKIVDSTKIFFCNIRHKTLHKLNNKH